MQELYLTETAQYADVVLPAAGWGEKAGTFTNANRTVHLSQKAVEPPGQARSDPDTFLDYSRRMGFQQLDGTPLLDWDGPEDALSKWKECTRGRPCGYTSITYDKLRGASVDPEMYKAMNPAGRAIFKIAPYQPAYETPDAEYSFRFTAG